MSVPAIEIVTASPEILEEATQASIEAFKWRSNPVKKWFREIAYGCATCVPAGIGVHLTICIGLPLLTTSALSNVLYLNSSNLADSILYMLPHSGLTGAIAAPILSGDISDTALRTGITVLSNLAAFGALYKKRLRYKAASIRKLNASLFVAGTVLSAAFNLGSFVQSKEAYQQWLADTPVESRQELLQAVDRPYIHNQFLSWMAYEGHSCLAPRRPGQSWSSYMESSTDGVLKTILTGVSAPLNGRLLQALKAQ